MDERQKKELDKLLSSPVQWDCPLRDFTSFGIGGPAEALVRVMDEEELVNLHSFLNENEISWRVIGRGTNLLVRDEGFAGVAIILDGKFKEYSIQEMNESVCIDVGAGFGLSRLCVMCMEIGYSGLEFAIGIPGTVGGAVVMNAGAWGGSMADVIVSVDSLDDTGPRTWKKNQLTFGYRKVKNLKEGSAVVTSAKIELKKSDADEIRKTCLAHQERRKKGQPSACRNAGSIFKNPQGDSAGRLIEASGLKGKRIGGAEVSEKHANFIINRGDANASDVLGLMEHVQERVREDSGIFLDPEVHIL